MPKSKTKVDLPDIAKTRLKENGLLRGNQQNQRMQEKEMFQLHQKYGQHRQNHINSLTDPPGPLQLHIEDLNVRRLKRLNKSENREHRRPEIVQ